MTDVTASVQAQINAIKNDSVRSYAQKIFAQSLAA
jgi:hypothetical protein